MDFRKVLVVSSVLALAAFAQGCGNACEDAAQEILDKADECGIASSDDGGEDGGDVECTDAAAAAAECLSGCYTAASCEGLKGEDAEAAASFGECLGECA